MNLLKSKDIDPLNIDNIYMADCSCDIQKKFKKNRDFIRIAQREEYQIEKKTSLEILSYFNKAVEQFNYEHLIISLAQFFNLIYDVDKVPQEYIEALKKTKFLLNVNKCLTTLQQFEIKYLLCFILLHLSFLSDDVISGMYEVGTLNILMEFFVDENNEIPKSIFFKLFGNACKNQQIASFYCRPLWDLVMKYISNDLILIQTSCLFCLSSLTVHFPFPDDIIEKLIQNFDPIIFKTSNLFRLLEKKEHCNDEDDYEYDDDNDEVEKELEQIINNSGLKTNDEDECCNDGEGFIFDGEYDKVDDENDKVDNENDKVGNEDECFEDDADNGDDVFNENLKVIKTCYYKLIYYIIDMIYAHSKVPKTCFYIVKSKIPFKLISVIMFYPKIIQQEILRIIKKIICVSQSVKERINFFKLLDIYILINLISPSNDLTNSIVYDIFYTIGSYDYSFIKELIQRKILQISVELLPKSNFHAKICILNFIAFVLINENDDDIILKEVVTQKVVEEFVEIAEQEEDSIKNCIGAVSKLYTLTYDQPDLNSMLKGFVVDTL